MVGRGKSLDGGGGDDLDREGRLGLRLIDWLAREESQGWFKKTRWFNCSETPARSDGRSGRGVGRREGAGL